MNNDVIYAHALGIAITDADLAEIEAQIESALPRPQYEGNSVISGGTRYCLARRTAGHNDTQLDGIMVDALLQQLDKDFIVKPFSYRCTVWMHKHLSEFKCADGYRFKQHELGRIADCEFPISFRRIDSEGYPI